MLSLKENIEIEFETLNLISGIALFGSLDLIRAFLVLWRRCELLGLFFSNVEKECKSFNLFSGIWWFWFLGFDKAVDDMGYVKGEYLWLFTKI